MRRFRQGATTGPSLKRPGAGYGKFCFGAPGPTQVVEPREELVPELFTGETKNIPETSKHRFKKFQDEQGDTVIDITAE